MAKTRREGSKTVRASKLPANTRLQVKRFVQSKVVQSLVEALRAHPPEVDLDEIEVVLRPNGNAGDLNFLLDHGGVCGNLVAEGTLNLDSTSGRTEVETIAHSLRIRFVPAKA